MKLSILFFLSFSTTLVFGQYQLMWADEFDDIELDLSKWNYDIGQGVWGWGNNELQYYTNSTSNIKLDTGYLHISAKEEPFGAANYTSAKIHTKGLYEFKYGKIESRIKIPVDQGIWPAFWMLGSNIDVVSWPQCGEIDVMEHVNNEALIHGTHHYNNNGHVYQGGSAAFDASEFNVYSIEWSPDAITWFLNGVQYYQTNIGTGSVSKEEFHETFYLILNLAVGGNWPGSPNATTDFPAVMLVDYVRVYQNEDNLSTEETALNELIVYPNPSQGSITFQGIENISSYAVFNVLGQKILTNSTEILDVSMLNAGMYYIKAEMTDGTFISTPLEVQ